MTRLSPAAQAIVDAGRAAQAPSEVAKAKVLAALDQAVLEPAEASALPSGTSGLAKVLMLSAIVAVLGVGYFATRSQNNSESGKVAVPVAVQDDAPAPVDSVERAPAVFVAPVVDPAPAKSPAPVAEEVNLSARSRKPVARRVSEDKAPAVPQPSAGDLLLAEQALLGAAQKAARDGDYDRAQALLARHRREFPSGILAPERNATIAMASCLAGDFESGKATGGAFLKAHPRSPLASQVRKRCQLDSTEDQDEKGTRDAQR